MNGMENAVHGNVDYKTAPNVVISVVKMTFDLQRDPKVDIFKII